MRDARAATACQRSSARTAARSVGRRWWCCVTTAGWSAPVQVFGRRDDETIHALRRCFDGHVWTPIVSSGDVAVMVSRLRQRALVTGPMDEDRGLTCAINWDDWHESLRSDLLRRAEAARHHPDAGWLCRRAPAAMRLPWPTWLHQPSPRRVQSSMALSRARVGVSDSVRSSIGLSSLVCRGPVRPTAGWLRGGTGYRLVEQSTHRSPLSRSVGFEQE